MNRKTRRRLLRSITAVPGVYPLLALLTARRALVRGPSMTPTLMPGERVLFDRLAYKVGRPRRGDILLARHISRPNMLMIKRVGEAGPDGYFLLGDNAEASTDSRQLGLVRRSDILARGWLVYWPPARVRRL